MREIAAVDIWGISGGRAFLWKERRVQKPLGGKEWHDLRQKGSQQHWQVKVDGRVASEASGRETEGSLCESC